MKGCKTGDDIAQEQNALMESGPSSSLMSQAPISCAVEAVHDLTLEAIRWMSEGYSGRIICCTANSKDWEGHTLNSLVEPQCHHVFIKTSDVDINRLHIIFLLGPKLITCSVPTLSGLNAGVCCVHQVMLIAPIVLLITIHT